MFHNIYQKFQSREGIFLAGSFALIVFSFCMIFGGFQYGYGNGQTPPTISVSGVGEMNVVPDIARFSATISKDAKTMADAQNLAATQGNVLVENLKKAGIAEKDIKTENFNAYPKYEYQSKSVSMPCGPDYCPPYNPGNQVIVGYTVSQTYSIKVRNLDQVNTIAQLLTDANISSVSGPDFTIDDVEIVKNEARAKAIDDAKVQAKILARQLGVRLGRIVDFQVNDGGYPVPLYARAMGGDAMMEKSVAPSIQPGETEVNTQVTITYRIR